MDKQVEVAFATANKQLIVSITVFETATIQQAIDESNILEQFTEIDLATTKVGVFGKVCSLSKIVEQGDRIEIYRPLQQNPMDARRQRATGTKATRTK